METIEGNLTDELLRYQDLTNPAYAKKDPSSRKQLERRKTRVRLPKGWQHEKFHINATPEEIAKALFPANPQDEPDIHPVDNQNPDTGTG